MTIKLTKIQRLLALKTSLILECSNIQIKNYHLHKNKFLLDFLKDRANLFNHYSKIFSWIINDFKQTINLIKTKT